MYNIIKNGFFKATSNEWEVLEGAKEQITIGKASCKGQQVLKLKQTVNVEKGHLFFLRCTIKVRGGMVRLWVEGSKEELFLKSDQVKDSQQVLYSNFTANESQVAIVIEAQKNEDVDIEIAGVEVINLSSIYGEGNEPQAKDFRQLLINNRKLNIEAKSRFVRLMNVFAQQSGMTQSVFFNASGLQTKGQVSTTRDLVKLLVLASGYQAIQKIWNTQQFTFTIQGPFTRNETVESTVMVDDLTKAFYVVGGKTGTIGPLKNLAVILEHPETLHWISLVITGAHGNRFAVVRDLVNNWIEGKEIDATQFKSLAIKEIKSEQPYTQLNKLNDLDVAINVDEPVRPASIIKLLTALLAVETSTSLYEELTVVEMDIVGGSGKLFRDGDIITLQEALYCMLLESSNTMANTVARHIGRKLLNQSFDN